MRVQVREGCVCMHFCMRGGREGPVKPHGGADGVSKHRWCGKSLSTCCTGNCTRCAPSRAPKAYPFCGSPCGRSHTRRSCRACGAPSVAEDCPGGQMPHHTGHTYESLAPCALPHVIRSERLW